MIGGMVVYYMSASALFGETSALVWLLGAAIVTFLIGAIFEVLFLRPMGEGKIERPKEYAILVTFGLAFFLQYLTQALVGANPVKSPRFFDFPDVAFPSEEDPVLIKTTAGNLRLFDTVSIPESTLRTAATISIILLLMLMWFLYRTWTGRGLRAVSQDRQASAVAGINPYRMNTLAFALGGMLAGLSGATLVQVFAWLPQVGIPASARAFVIIVLGRHGIAARRLYRRHHRRPGRSAGRRLCARSDPCCGLHPGLRHDHPDPDAPAQADRSLWEGAMKKRRLTIGAPPSSGRPGGRLSAHRCRSGSAIRPTSCIWRSRPFSMRFWPRAGRCWRAMPGSSPLPTWPSWPSARTRPRSTAPTIRITSVADRSLSRDSLLRPLPGDCSTPSASRRTAG